MQPTAPQTPAAPQYDMQPEAAPLSVQLQKRLFTFKRHRKVLLSVGGGILATALIAAVAWPATYRATGTILIEQQEMPSDFVKAAISSYADQRVQVVSQRVMTSINLMEVVNKYNLYPKERQTKSRDAIVEKMRNDIELKMISADVVDPKLGRATKATIAFSLSYDGKSPREASSVANELTTLFLRENVDLRKEQAAGTADFLSGERERLGQQVAALEQKMATFKAKNEGALPELTQVNLQLSARAQDDLRELDSRVRSLDQQIVFLQAQLAQINPTATLYGDTGSRVLTGTDQLRVLRTQYATALAKYSPTHPDVVRLKNEIAGLESAVGSQAGYRDTLRDLEGKRAELNKLRETRTPEHPDVLRLQREIDQLQKQAQQQAEAPITSANEAPDNPAYIQIKASLTAAQADRAAVIQQRAAINARIADYERKSAAMPAVERDYSALARDLDVARKAYAEVLAKQSEAQISSNLETERKGERFTLIEPPTEPQKPAKPNRPLVAALGLLLALLAIGGGVLLIEAFDTRIHGRDDITVLLHVPPLAVIPWIETAEAPRG